MARKIDRPRGHVISDATLLEIARQKPKTAIALREQIRLSEKAAAKYGTTISAIIETTSKQRPSTYPDPHLSIRLSKNDKMRMENLNKLITLKCELLGIAPSLLGNASELKRLVKTLNSTKKNEPDQLRQTDGWRKHFLEDFLRQSNRK